MTALGWERSLCMAVIVISSLRAGVTGLAVLAGLVCACTRPVVSGPGASPAGDDASLGAAERWALAADALSVQENALDQGALGMTRDPATVQKLKGSLHQVWNIDSRTDLVSTLAWLEDHGHRERFEAMGRTLEALGPNKLNGAAMGSSDDPFALAALDLVRRTRGQLGPKSILAWDLVRVISLARMGYAVGYLDRDEAWAQILRVSGPLRASFTSWQDLTDDYLVGRQFWSFKLFAQGFERMQVSYGQLVNDPASPWAQTSWDLDPDEFARACARHLDCRRLPAPTSG